jgi:hypothetical protein
LDLVAWSWVCQKILVVLAQMSSPVRFDLTGCLSQDGQNSSTRVHSLYAPTHLTSRFSQQVSNLVFCWLFRRPALPESVSPGWFCHAGGTR